MSRILGILSIVGVVLLAMAFAAANAGHWTTLELGIITLFRVPVTLVAFSGLLTGMLVMFVAGISSDLKVRRILRERLAEEAQQEQRWIDRHQQDLFALDEEEKDGENEPMVRVDEPLDVIDPIPPGPSDPLDPEEEPLDPKEEPPKE